MTRLFATTLLLLSAVILSGCGITGDLDRPPPLWGEAIQGEALEGTQTAEALEDSDESENDPFGEDEDEDDLGYGINVVD